MWTYEQATGRLYAHDGELLATGYAGKGGGRNNPALQAVHNVGPLPVGLYTIGAPHDSPHTGPFTLNLTPDIENEMHGRSLFRIHGDNDTHDASDGCIILPRVARAAIHLSGDVRLSVVEKV